MKDSKRSHGRPAQDNVGGGEYSLVFSSYEMFLRADDFRGTDGWSTMLNFLVMRKMT